MTKAFLAVEGEAGAESSRIKDIVGKITNQVVETLMKRLPDGGVLHIEHIQDQVEIGLMRSGEHEVAKKLRSYIETNAPKNAVPTKAMTLSTPSPLSELMARLKNLMSPNLLR